MNRRWTAALFVLTLSACGAEEATPPTEDPVDEVAAIDESAVEDTSEEAAEELEIAADEFPIPEDFEEEAAGEIRAENLEEQVAALEAELAE